MATPKRATIVLVMGDRSARADAESFCDRAAILEEGGAAGSIVCDLAAVSDPDVGTIEALARLQLLARRLGRRLQLRNASSELQDLLELLGLRDIVPPCPGLSLEPRRQSEEREQLRGIQEESDPADPVA